MTRKKAILLNEPHQVTKTGSFVHFETDMVAPLEITGSGNITICGKNMFHFDDSEMILLKTGSGNQRWGYIIMPSLTTIILSATNISTDTGNFNINATRHYGMDENAYATNILINNSGTVTNRLFISSNGSFISLLSSYSSTNDNAKNATKKKINAYNIQCEYGTSATEFEEYIGTTASVDTPRYSLKGTNNIWSDSGSITVKYWTH